MAIITTPAVMGLLMSIIQINHLLNPNIRFLGTAVADLDAHIVAISAEFGDGRIARCR